MLECQDLLQTQKVGLLVLAALAGRARRGLEQPRLIVKVQRANGDSGEAGKFANSVGSGVVDHGLFLQDGSI
jgi:hypothetical protein